MKKYIYTQNNSGGFYTYPEWTGPEYLGGVFNYFGGSTRPVDVWVMAESEAEANELAQKYAEVYFHGCAKAIDCECCGDRWHSGLECDA